MSLWTKKTHQNWGWSAGPPETHQRLTRCNSFCYSEICSLDPVKNLRITLTADSECESIEPMDKESEHELRPGQGFCCRIIEFSRIHINLLLSKFLWGSENNSENMIDCVFQMPVDWAYGRGKRTRIEARAAVFVAGIKKVPKWKKKWPAP